MSQSVDVAAESRQRLKFHLPYLHCFWQVARLRSFTRAADQLNIGQSAVSYQIAKLEGLLGQQLIHRSKGSGFQLSREGEMLADQCSRIFLQLEQTLGAFGDGSLVGELRIAAPTCFGSLLLTRVMAALAQSAPGLKVDLALSDQHVDLRRQQIDLAIRTMTTGMDVATVPLLHTSMAFVAAPEYLQRQPPVERLGDLTGQRLILSAPNNPDWANLLQQHPEVSEAPPAFVYIDNVWGILHATRAGLGIAYLARYAAIDGLASGELVELLPGISRELPLTLCLSTHSDIERDRRLQAFLGELSSLLDAPPYAELFERVGPLWV